MGLKEDAESLGIRWCGPDDCPAAICGGPHVLYENDNGDTLLAPLGAEVVLPGFRPIAGEVK